ncbi:hypothetical protein C8J56DRAFT_1051857 [Mycena floridula]|nr:hypothetical protein C8J56DRAFT_1051857 [Mycena floridula]
MPLSIDEVMKLTVNEILGAIENKVPRIPYSIRSNKTLLVAFACTLDDAATADLRNLALAAAGRNKQKAKATKASRVVAQRTQRNITAHRATSARKVFDVQHLIDGPFFRSPNQQYIDDCIGLYIDETGNKTLTNVICVVCARSL